MYIIAKRFIIGTENSSILCNTVKKVSLLNCSLILNADSAVYEDTFEKIKFFIEREKKARGIRSCLSVMIIVN